MRGIRAKAVDRGWIVEGESLLVPRLSFPLAADLPEVLHDFNRTVRDRVVNEILAGAAHPEPNPPLFGPEEEVTVAEVERYGIPLRTVLGKQSGLMRSDPYYSEAYIGRFYSEHYRGLYRPRRFSQSWFFSEQIRKGQRIIERVGERLPASGRVLDIGCGMGGMLVPFRFAGHQVCGCDYGEDYAAQGKSLGLDIRIGGPECVSSERKFDLIILSHVVEHVRNPVEFLALAASLLNDDGVCYIEVPGLLDLDRFYQGDLLQYLQNAHRWHFTADTLGVVLRRAGLETVEIDEAVSCVARRAAVAELAFPDAGRTVLAEISRLEHAYAARVSNVAA